MLGSKIHQSQTSDLLDLPLTPDPGAAFTLVTTAFNFKNRDHV
jgi:hypothetical protein